MDCFDVPKIKDVITMSNGFFSHLDYTFLFDVDGAQLDIMFYANYGERSIAPLITLYTPTIDPYPLSNQILEDIGELITAYYKKKWDRLAAVYNIEYDPIHNYLDEWEDEEDGAVDTTFGGSLTTVDTLGTSTTHSLLRTDNLSEEEEHDMRNDNTREFENEDTTYYNSKLEHEIPVSHPMIEETQYGKTDERIDATVKTNTGTESTVNSGSDTNAVWGFNSGANPVNSERMTAGTTAEHVIDPHDPLVEENSGTVIHNYGGSDTVTKYGSDVEEKTGNDRIVHDGTITDQSSEFGTVTTTNTGTQSTSGTDATTGSNTRVATDARTRGESTDRNRSGRHFGNIGNLTSQKMINEEIELWKWSYVNTILEDVRDFLTLSVYL